MSEHPRQRQASLNLDEPRAIYTPCEECGKDARETPQGACWRDLDARRVCLFCVRLRHDRHGLPSCARFNRYIREHFTCPHFLPTCENP